MLAKRAVNDQVAQEILQAAQNIDEAVKSTGEDLRSINPTDGIKAGGLSTIEEKSLGAIHKSGTKPIQGVIEYGARPGGAGFTGATIIPG